MRKFLGLIVSAFLVALVLNPVAAEAATKRTISLKSSKSSVTVGQKFVLSGKVSKSPKGTKVTLQRKSGKSAWKTIKTVKTSSKSGSFKLSGVKIGGKGTFSYRAKVSKTKKLKAATSKSISVKASYPRGSRQNPWAVEDAVRLGDWALMFGETEEDAYDLINASSQGEWDIEAELPAEGYSYVAAPVAVKYLGKGSAALWLEVSIDFLGSDGRIYDESDGDCFSVPNSWWDIDDLYTNAEAEAMLCAEVPTGAVRGGLWRAQTYDANYDKYEAFFKLH